MICPHTSYVQDRDVGCNPRAFFWALNPDLRTREADPHRGPLDVPAGPSPKGRLSHWTTSSTGRKGWGRGKPSGDLTLFPPRKGDKDGGREGEQLRAEGQSQGPLAGLSWLVSRRGRDASPEWTAPGPAGAALAELREVAGKSLPCKTGPRASRFPLCDPLRVSCDRAEAVASSRNALTSRRVFLILCPYQVSYWKHQTDFYKYHRHV